MILDNTQVGFFVLATVAVVASLRAIMHSNPVHAILALIVSLLAVAGILFLLGAPFAGVLEIIVYAGAILVLFVFVIMMLNLGHSTDAQEKSWLSVQVWTTPVLLAAIAFMMICAFVLSQQAINPLFLSPVSIDAKAVGKQLFSHYGLVVQMAAFLLLGALVAAYHLGKKALDDENASHFQNRSADSADSLPNANLPGADLSDSDLPKPDCRGDL